jgi:hypothetical protein
VHSSVQQNVSTSLTMTSSIFNPQSASLYDCAQSLCQARVFMLRQGVADPPRVDPDNVTVHSITDTSRRRMQGGNGGVAFDLTVSAAKDIAAVFTQSCFAEEFIAAFQRAVSHPEVAALATPTELATLTSMARLVTTTPPVLSPLVVSATLEFVLQLHVDADPSDVAGQLQNPVYAADMLASIGLDPSLVIINTTVRSFVWAGGPPVPPTPQPTNHMLLPTMLAVTGALVLVGLLGWLLARLHRHRATVLPTVSKYQLSDKQLIKGDGEDLVELHNGELEAGALHLKVLWDPLATPPEGEGAVDGGDGLEKSKLLRVTVVAGHALRKMDAIGANDVYVRVRTEFDDADDDDANQEGIEGEHRTSTVDGGGSNPVWDGGVGEELRFWLPRMPARLQLLAMDADVGSADDEIGRCSLVLGSNNEAAPWARDDWVVLRQRGTRSAAPPPPRLVEHSCEAYLGGTAVFTIENAPGDMECTLEGPRGIRLLSEAQAVRRDLEEQGAKMHAVASEVEEGHKQSPESDGEGQEQAAGGAERGVSAVADADTDATDVGDEFTQLEEQLVSEMPWLAGEPPQGRGEAVVGDAFDDGAQSTGARVPPPSGAADMASRVVSGGESRRVRRRSWEGGGEACGSGGRPGGDRGVGPPCEGVLCVTVVGCHGLLSADRNGLSDPFVRLSLGGQRTQETSVRPRQLDPTWEETLRWFVPADSCGGSAAGDDAGDALTLRLVVLDHDSWGQDDFLGELTIDLPAEFGGGGGAWLTESVQWRRPLQDPRRQLASCGGRAVAKQLRGRRAAGNPAPLGTVGLELSFAKAEPVCTRSRSAHAFRTVCARFGWGVSQLAVWVCGLCGAWHALAACVPACLPACVRACVRALLLTCAAVRTDLT